MTFRPAALLLAAWLSAPATATADQDALARAKDLYATAAYDEALAALDALPKETADGESIEAAEYRVFCLLALERRDDARKAIEGLVTAHPLYHLPDGKTSPRIQTVFREIRRQMFPDIVQRAYADAKAAFDRKDADAGARFDRVIALLDDPDAQGVATLADLRTVAVGFRDLSKAAAASAAAAPPPSPHAAPSPQAAPPEQPQTTSPPEQSHAQSSPPDAQTSSPDAARDGKAAESPVGTAGPTAHAPTAVVPPVAIYQPIPPWVTSTPADKQTEYKGTLELVIDRTGQVTDVKLRKSINPRYDVELLRAARTWRFRPATKDGEPTPFVKVVDVQLIPR